MTALDRIPAANVPAVPPAEQKRRVDVIVGLVERIAQLAQFVHFNLPEAAYDSYLEELGDLPFDQDQFWAAVRSLLAEDSYRFPSAQLIRRRVLEEAGLLAMPTGEAMALIREAACTPGFDLKSLPGPVRQAVRGHGGLSAIATSDNSTAIYAQVRDSYEALARKHDRFVLEPGGLARLAEVADWFDAVEQRQQNRLMAMTAAIELELDYIPFDPSDCQRVLDQYRDRFGDEPPRPYGAPEPEPDAALMLEAGEGARRARAAMKANQRRLANHLALHVDAIAKPI